MTAIEKPILWSIVVFVLALVGARVFVGEGPGAAWAQPPPPDASLAPKAPASSPSNSDDTGAAEKKEADAKGTPVRPPTTGSVPAALVPAPAGPPQDAPLTSDSPIEASAPARAGQPQNVPVSVPAKVAEPVVNGPVVVFPVARPARDIVDLLKVQYSGKANISTHKRENAIIVRAPSDVQAEIRGILNFLDRPGVPQPIAAPPATAGNVLRAELPMTGEQSAISVPADNHPSPGLSSNAVIDAAVKRLREARGDADKQAARTDLRRLLTRIFDDDMQNRQRQAQEIETRLAGLRQQYAARQKVKDQIVDLQLKVVEYDAEGLGFPAEPTGPMPGTSATRPRGRAGGSQPAPKTVPYREPFATRPQAGNAFPFSKFFTAARDLSFTALETERLMARPLAEVKRTYIAAVNDLSGRGHFVESPDGRYFAYVTGQSSNSPAAITVVEAPTGRLVTIVLVNEVPQPLQFTDRGLVECRPDGTRPLLVPLPREARADAAEVEMRYRSSTPAAPGRVAAVVPFVETIPSASQPSVVADYSLLRGRYVTARHTLKQCEETFNARVKAAQNETPKVHVDDVKKQHPREWEIVETARKAWEEVRKLYEAKLRLLQIDVQVAENALQAAQSAYAERKKLYERNVVPLGVVTDHATRLAQARLELERAKTIYDLFHSIRDEGQPETPARPSGR